MSSGKLNPLSNPKGVKYECELCGKVATLVCQFCRVSYYCSREHQAVDWSGIHEKICPLVVPLRVPSQSIGSEDERVRRLEAMKESKKGLIELSKTESMKYLFQGEHELAIPGALQCLRFSVDIYGSGRTELVPPYLMLAEANLGLGRFQQAEEFLSLANWNILKNPDCSNGLRSKLHRNFGKLYVAQDRHHEALRHLAIDIYFSSLNSGPEDVETTGGYFLMGNVFISFGNNAAALALYDKVVDIWFKFITNLYNATNDDIVDPNELGEAEAVEAVEMLERIFSIRSEVMNESTQGNGDVCYVLGMLFLHMGDKERACEKLERATRIYTAALGEDAQTTIDVRETLRQIKEKIVEDDTKRATSRMSTRSDGASASADK